MRTRPLKLQSTDQLASLNAVTASVWRECLVLKEMWDDVRGYRTRGNQIDSSCELWMDKQLTKSQPLHSQSIQEVRRRFFKNRKGFREKRPNGDEKSKPLHRDKRYQTTPWKKSAIHFNGNLLVLSNGNRHGEPLKVRLPKKFDLKYAMTHIAIVELVYDKGQYSLHFVYGIEKPLKKESPI